MNFDFKPEYSQIQQQSGGRGHFHDMQNLWGVIFNKLWWM